MFSFINKLRWDKDKDKDKIRIRSNEAFLPFPNPYHGGLVISWTIAMDLYHSTLLCIICFIWNMKQFNDTAFKIIIIHIQSVLQRWFIIYLLCEYRIIHCLKFSLLGLKTCLWWVIKVRKNMTTFWRNVPTGHCSPYIDTEKIQIQICALPV